MKQKILAFVVNGEKKFLALYSKSHPEHGEGGWFVVTGGVDEDESHEEAVKREVKEETGLDVKEIVDLNWGSRYEWNGEDCEEKNFLSFVSSGVVVLNEENIEYQWLGLEDFVERIRWDGDKGVLEEKIKT